MIRSKFHLQKQSIGCIVFISSVYINLKVRKLSHSLMIGTALMDILPLS